MLTMLNIDGEPKIIETPTLVDRLWESIVDLWEHARTEIVEGMLAANAAWWAFTMFADDSLFKTRAGFRVLATIATQEFVGMLAIGLVLCSISAFLLHHTVPRSLDWLRPKLTMAYVGFHGAVFGMIFYMVPFGPTNGANALLAALGAWAFVRIKHPKRQ